MRTHQAVPEAPGLSCTDPHLAEVILDAAVPHLLMHTSILVPRGYCLSRKLREKMLPVVSV